jgi:hypothetical protein
VDFFSRDGRKIGDKRSLEQVIHEITNISISALRGKPLSQFSVAERMSWVKARSSMREEDQAYSLLGIFGIHMPLIYGEGLQNAFRRLKREIEESSGASISSDLFGTEMGTPMNTESQSSHFFLLGNYDQVANNVDHITDSGYGGSGASKAQLYGKITRDSLSPPFAATVPKSEAESTSYDTLTVYSDTESLKEPSLLEYVTAFADELHKSLPSGFDKTEFDRVFPVFEELLQTFAFKMSFDGSTTMHRNLMYLVYRYRR